MMRSLDDLGARESQKYTASRPQTACSRRNATLQYKGSISMPSPGPRHRVADFDFDEDPPLLTLMAAIYNAMNPDLSRFKARGGELLMYHGLASDCHAGRRPGYKLDKGKLIPSISACR
jgi:hypothetical protein